MRECEEVVVSELQVRALGPGWEHPIEDRKSDQPNQLQKRHNALRAGHARLWLLLDLCGGGELSKRTRQGKKQVLMIFKPGDLLGAAELLADKTRYKAYAKALEDTQTILINKAEFLELMRRHSAFALGVSQRLARYALAYQRRLTDICYKGVRDRLTALLLELGRKYGVKKKNGVLIDVRLTNEELAGMIGSTPETVSLALGSLKRRGLIERDQHKVVLLNEGG